MRVKKSVTVISFIILISFMFVALTLSISKYGNPYNFSKSGYTPQEAIQKVLKNSKVYQVIIRDDIAVAVCQKDNKQVVRYLMSKENGKWYDRTENIIYCRDNIIKDDSEDNGYSIKVKKFEGKYYICVEQFNYLSTNKYIEISDSVGTEILLCEPTVNGEKIPIWLWSYYNLPDNYSITINGETYYLDN